MKAEYVAIAIIVVGGLLIFSSSCKGCSKKVYSLTTDTGAMIRSDQTSPKTQGFHYVSTNGWLFMSDEGLY